MANLEHVAKLKEGAKSWNDWRMTVIYLSVGLRGLNLNAVEMVANPFRGIDFDLTYFPNPDLVAANLGKTNLRGSNLTVADLRVANLREADLTNCDLRWANLNGADLRGANLAGAVLQGTVFGSTNLTNVMGLDACFHSGPSVLDQATLVRSGSLPLQFLRGCGLPNNFIDYLPSLLNQPVQFHSCFISYSTKDQEFADRLHADLQNAGVRCWFAAHDIKGGEKIHEQIDEAIHVYDRLLLILSDNSMSSEWVKTEIAKSRKREIREKRRMLFPVRLVEFQALKGWECFDADTGKDSAREIREYFIPDFSNWKNHDSYKTAFDRLIRDLAAKDSAASA
jgi:hypothetical protein